MVPPPSTAPRTENEATWEFAAPRFTISATSRHPYRVALFAQEFAPPAPVSNNVVAPNFNFQRLSMSPQAVTRITAEVPGFAAIVISPLRRSVSAMEVFTVFAVTFRYVVLEGPTCTHVPGVPSTVQTKTLPV